MTRSPKAASICTKALFAGCIVTLLVGGSFLHARGADFSAYEQLGKRAMAQLISGNIDEKTFAAEMDDLINMGIEAATAYGNENPESKKMMSILVENALGMKQMDLDTIESQWHDGGVYLANGINSNAMDHFSREMCLTDLIVHPSTASICVREFFKTNDKNYLAQAKAEIKEVLEHLHTLEE